MLIACSGKAQSGKDTFVNAWWYWMKRQEESLFGESDLSFEKYNDIIKVLKTRHNWSNVKFAGALKEICGILLNIPAYRFEEKEMKDSLVNPIWSLQRIDDFVDIGEGLEVVYKDYTPTVREFLIYVGDLFRPQGWINALFQKYDESCNWIITDMRFKNEKQAVELKHGTTIRINRDVETMDIPSETELDNESFDYTIENNGSLNEFADKVKQIMIDLKVIPCTM